MIWWALSLWGCLLVIKTVCFQSGFVCIGTYKNVGCPLVILADARLEARCPQCVGASSVDPQTGKTWGDSMPEVAVSM